MSAVGPQTPYFPEVAADPDALAMGVKPFSVEIDVVFEQFPDVDVDVLLSAVEKVVDLIPSEVKDEMDAVGDVPVGDEASKVNLLRYLGKLRDAVSAYCLKEGATFPAGDVDPLVVSFAAADFRRIFLETFAEAFATYKGTLADDLVDAVSEEKLESGFFGKCYVQVQGLAAQRYAEAHEPAWDVVSAGDFRRAAHDLMLVLDPSVPPPSLECLSFCKRLPASLRSDVVLGGAERAHVVQCAVFLHAVVMKIEERCHADQLGLEPAEFLPTDAATLRDPEFVRVLEEHHRARVSEILDTLPDQVDRQSWEAEYTRKTYETVRAAAAKTLLDTPPAPPLCVWAPIQADRFGEKAGDLLAGAANECGTEALEELRSLLPESLRLAVSPVPVKETSHLLDDLSWLLTVMTRAGEFCAEHQIQATLRPFQWRNRDAEFFDVFKTHHATKLAEFRASLPDIALASLSPEEFARDWTTKNLGRLFRETEAVHPAGSPVPGRVPIRKAPDTPDPTRVDTNVASPKRLRVSLGGAPSAGSPIGGPGPALAHPAQVSTVEQLQDTGFVAGEYQTVEGRVVRASDFHAARQGGKPKMCCILAGASETRIRIICFDINPIHRDRIKMDNVVRVSYVQRQPSYPPLVGFECLFNDIGKSGRRPSTIEVLLEDPQYPCPMIHLKTFGDMRSSPLGDVAQSEDFRAKLVDAGARFHLNSSRRALTLEDEHREQKTVTVWENYALREWNTDGSIGKTFMFLGAERGYRRPNPNGAAMNREEQMNVWYDAAILACTGELEAFALP